MGMNPNEDNTNETNNAARMLGWLLLFLIVCTILGALALLSRVFVFGVPV